MHLPLTALHLTWCFMYLYVFSQLDNIAKSNPYADVYGRKWKYLTHLNLVLQLVSFSLSLIYDVVGVFKGARDFLFTSLAFPFGVYVSITYWGLMAHDPSLVMAGPTPPLEDHMMHTAPIVSVVLEMMLVNHVYPRRIIRTGTCALFTTAYSVWVLHIAAVSGHWVYPILKELGPVARACFIGASTIAALTIQILAEFCVKRKKIE